MKKLKIFTAFILIFAAAAISSAEKSGEIRVMVSNLKSDKGEVRIALFNSKEGFPTKSTKAIKKGSVKINGSKAEYIFKNIPFGTYAVSVLHDENNNKKMDTNWIGIPNEGYGASMNPKSSFGPPSFDDAAFKLDSSMKKIMIKAAY